MRGYEHLTAGDVARMGRKGLRIGSKPRSKYGAVKVTIYGVTFASKAEGRRYVELKALQAAGEITGLILQPRYDLTVEGVTVGRYVADFSYTSAGGEIVVEDVKGMAGLPLFRWKVKHLKAQYGIRVTEIR